MSDKSDIGVKMGRIVAAGTFVENPELTVIFVECDIPADKSGNRFFLEICREWGESLIWVRTWHSDTIWSKTLESFDNCTIY